MALPDGSPVSFPGTMDAPPGQSPLGFSEVFQGSLKYSAMAFFSGLFCARIHITRKKAIIAVTKSA